MVEVGVEGNVKVVDEDVGLSSFRTVLIYISGSLDIVVRCSRRRCCQRGAAE